MSSEDQLVEAHSHSIRHRWFGSSRARNVFIAVAVGIGAVAVVLVWYLGKGIKPRALGGPIRIVEVDEATLKRGFLGIDFDSATEEQLESAGIDHGVAVTRVLDDSPADRAGIETGDILTTVNGVPIGTRADLKTLSADWLPGQAVSLTVIHSAADDRSEQVITAQLMSFAEMQELMSRKP
jgi:S1-C subfamily serine protease